MLAAVAESKAQMPITQLFPEHHTVVVWIDVLFRNAEKIFVTALLSVQIETNGETTT